MAKLVFSHGSTNRTAYAWGRGGRKYVATVMSDGIELDLNGNTLGRYESFDSAFVQACDMESFLSGR